MTTLALVAIAVGAGTLTRLAIAFGLAVKWTLTFAAMRGAFRKRRQLVPA